MDRMDRKFVWAVASIYYQAYRTGTGDGAWVTADVNRRVVRLAARFSKPAPLEIEAAREVITETVASHAATKLDRWAAGRAIVKLVGADLFDAKAAGLLVALDIPVDAFSGIGSPRLDREIQAEQVLAANGIPTCARTLPTQEPAIVLDPLHKKLTFNSCVATTKTVTEVATPLDPQSWPQCNEFFNAVYVMQHDPDYKFPKDQRPPPHGTTEPVGGTWRAVDLIFERFVLSPAFVSIENALGIQATLTDANTYDLAYWLDHSWYSEFFTVQGPGGLTADDGFARARTNATGGSDVTGQKVLGFQDRNFPEQGPPIDGEDLMYWTAFSAQFSMDRFFLHAICC